MGATGLLVKKENRRTSDASPAETTTENLS